jgi:protein-L-isoaspartate(D-aspartate) O-methyltransferase
MTEHVFDPMRRAMVASQLRTTGVSDPRVIAAMGEVARERFVPDGRQAMAYADALVPLGDGRALNPPMALGRMLTEAELTGSEHALVIGAGSGYSAAVLARLVRSVIALEENPALIAQAKKAGVAAVKGPLAKGWPKAAPYDFILIDGAVELVPQAIVAQVADGGRISFALVDRGITRLAIGRVAAGAFGVRVYADAAAAVLPGFEGPRGFSF